MRIPDEQTCLATEFEEAEIEKMDEGTYGTPAFTNGQLMAEINRAHADAR